MTNLNNFNIFNGGMVLPKKIQCQKCGCMFNYSPFQVITYANRKKIIDNLCDSCTVAVVHEGQQKLRAMGEQIDKQYKAQRKAINRRLLNEEKNAQNDY